MNNDLPATFSEVALFQEDSFFPFVGLLDRKRLDQ